MFNENDKVLIWISLFNFLTLKKQKSLIELYAEPKELWYNFKESNERITGLLHADEISKMMFLKDDTYLKTYYENLKEQNITALTLFSNDYPNLLKEIDYPPLVLYCKGDISLLNSKCLAIVGTRRPTRYGRETTYMFSSNLARSGLTIVSGLADGVDTEAHRAALDVKGKTIAVLGCGVNEIYPVSNSGLAKEVIKHGLLISEYKPNEKPQSYYFPARNRIIAGLSEGVLITEAGEKSGSMHTKNYALDYNRSLYVVPGRINDAYSKGCNLIIKNLQASMVLNPQDILQNYNLELKNEPKQLIQLDLNDEIILSLLGVEEIHYEELLMKSGLEAKKLNTTLTRLELKGLIKKLSGNFYCK